jgi:hypothetical protein
MITPDKIEQLTGLTNVVLTYDQNRVISIDYEGEPPEWFEDWVEGLSEGKDPENLDFLTDRIALRKVRKIVPVKNLEDIDRRVGYYHVQLTLLLAKAVKGETLTPGERQQANTLQDTFSQLLPIVFAAQRIKEENENPINNPRWP